MRILNLLGAEGRRDIGIALVTEARRRGLEVAVLLKAPEDFDPDVPGKDSWRHRKAGAREVLLASARARALMSEPGGEVDAPMVAGRLDRTDILLVDGDRHPDGVDIEISDDGTVRSGEDGILSTGPAGAVAAELLNRLLD